MARRRRRPRRTPPPLRPTTVTILFSKTEFALVVFATESELVCHPLELRHTDRVLARLGAFPLVGFAFTLSGCLSMGVASALIKSNRTVDVFLTASVRNLVVFALAVPCLRFQRTSMRLRGQEGRLVLLRAFVSTVGVLIFFYSFRNIPLGEQEVPAYLLK